MGNNGSFDAPWETPEVQTVINIFDGVVTNIKSLNQIEVQSGGYDDEQDF